LRTLTKDCFIERLAFFLFNNEGKLLLQRRSEKKITFPDCWTNTVCSHPLFSNTQNDESKGVEGVKIAAQRKLFHELGIPAEEVPIANMKFLTRIHYKAISTDEKWGEHEMDYILFIKSNKISVTPNAGEVKDYKFVAPEEVKQIVEEAKLGKHAISPWFGLIFSKLLSGWWDKLLRGIDLPSDNQIHRF